MPKPHDLLEDTAVTPVSGKAKTYHASLPDAWSFVLPSGGVVMTVALRALRAALADPTQAPIAATATFSSRIPAGPMQIEVEVIRRGRSASQLRGRLTSRVDDGPGVEVSATFGRDRRGPTMCDATKPDVPNVDAARTAPQDRFGHRPAIFTNYEVRNALGDVWWEREWPAERAETARWFRYLRRPSTSEGTIDHFALPPILDTMPSALVQALGSDHPRVIAPSLDLTVHFLEETRGDWLLVRNRCRRTFRGYATGDSEVWDADGRLLAVASQTMLLKQL